VFPLDHGKQQQQNNKNNDLQAWISLQMMQQSLPPLTMPSLLLRRGHTRRLRLFNITFSNAWFPSKGLEITLLVSTNTNTLPLAVMNEDNEKEGEGGSRARSWSQFGGDNAAAAATA